MTLPYVETRTGGWLYDREDRELLDSTEWEIPYSAMPMSSVPSEIHRDYWMPVEDQGPMGSCAGNASSTCLEVLLVEFGGRHVQLSRMAAYRLAQIKDGIQSDQGSTISAGCHVATEVGICTEEVWPYPSGYTTQVPRDYAESVKYRCVGHSPLRTYAEVLKHLHLGPVYIGVMWSGGVDRAVSNGDGVLEAWPTGGAGGHSICALGYHRRDYQGKPLPGELPYIEWLNSWSMSWGNQGRFLTSPRATQQMIDGRWSEFRGLFGWLSPPAEFHDYGELSE